MTKKIDFLVPAVVLSLLCPRLSLVVDAAPPARGQSSLVGHWRLDDIGQDARIDDASPNGLHGILAGATADLTARPAGRSGSRRPAPFALVKMPLPWAG
jgi:hypothetical protein